jgi:hypothetical protein
MNSALDKLGRRFNLSCYSVTSTKYSLPTDMSKIQLLISVNEEYKDRLPEVAENLQSAGMQVDQWLVGIGVITGSADSENIEQLRQMPGVAAIEAAAGYQIAPPDSDLQ